MDRSPGKVVLTADGNIRRLKGQECGYKDDHALNNRRIG